MNCASPPLLPSFPSCTRSLPIDTPKPTKNLVPSYEIAIKKSTKANNQTHLITGTFFCLTGKLIKMIKALTLFAVIGMAAAECPNACSGHGDCSAFDVSAVTSSLGHKLCHGPQPTFVGMETLEFTLI